MSVNVGIMMGGQGPQLDVFAATAQFLKERKRRQEAVDAATRQNYSAAQDKARRWGRGRGGRDLRGVQ